MSSRKRLIKIFSAILLSAIFLTIGASDTVVRADTENNSTVVSGQEITRLSLIEKLLQQIIELQKLLVFLQASESKTTNGPSQSNVWDSSEGSEEIDNRGPKYNAMSCSHGLEENLSNGALACYGLWDYGDEFGNDTATCGGLDPILENRLPTGCVIPAKQCSTGRAIATDYFRIGEVSSQKITELAKNLNATEVAVQEQLVSVWEYKCTSKPLTDLHSEIDVNSIQKNYGPKEAAWEFVDSTADIVVVGVYEGSAIDNSVVVDVSSINQDTLLVLSAYEPVNWKLTGANLQQVKGIFITGYENQRINGIPDGVDVISAIYEKRDEGDHFIVYTKDDPEFYRLQDYLNDKTGYKPYLFFGGYSEDYVKVSLKG